MEHRYTELLAKRRKEAEREGETYVRFLGVLRGYVPNPDFIERPAGKDTRTANQKRKSSRTEKSKTLEALKVTKGRKSQAKKDEETETNIRIALEAWREELEAEEALKDADAEPKQSVYETVKDFVDSREALSKSVDWNPDAILPGNARVIQKSTVRDYRHTLKRLEADFSEIPVTELRLPFVKKWEDDQLKKAVSLAVIRKCHVLMKSALDDAVLNGLIEANPISALKAPRLSTSSEGKGGTRADMQFVTRKILESRPTPPIVGGALALHAGLRCGEICGLRWSDVDLDLRAMKVHRAIGVGDGGKFVKGTKSKSSARVLYIDYVLLDTLQRRKELVFSEFPDLVLDLQDTYVIGDVTGEFLCPTTLSRKWTALAESWGLQDMRGGTMGLHGLRHCFSTAMRATKTNVDEERTRMQLMGHASVAMTEYYGDHTWSMTIPTMMAAAAWMMPDESTPRGADVFEFAKAGNE